MGWVKWLRDWSAAPAKTPGQPGGKAAARPRSRRKAGDAYAKEWVRVLEDSGAASDPDATDTWELQTGMPRPAGNAAGAPVRRSSAPTEPYDTFTWELQEGDSPDDPWGLQKHEAEAARAKSSAGINPYDTGVFDASWTGRFDKR
jgi:hypothetical protein